METTERDYIADVLYHPAYEGSLTRELMWIVIYRENLVYNWHGWIDGVEERRVTETPACPEYSLLERAWDWLVDSMMSLGEHGDKILWFILGAFITIIVLGILAGVLN
jgi:hypothetical protein